jgi:hypothetical protein
MPSSPTTIVVERDWRWRHSRCYMVIGVKPHYFGVRQMNGRFLGQIYCRKPRDKFVWRGSTWGLCSQGRRDMSTIGEDKWVLKLEITCTSRYHLWEVYDVSRYEANSHLRLLDRSRSRKRDKKNWRQNFQISFLIHSNLEGEIHFKGGRFATPLNVKFWNVTKIH